MDPAIRVLVALALAIIVIGLVLRRLRQPHVVGYIIAGVVLGPSGLGVVTDVGAVSRLGAFGVLLLVFFIGMELPLRSLVARWRIPIVGTTAQVLLGIACVLPLGLALDWTTKRTLFIAFVISMSSTAVILNLLRERSQLHHPLGRDVTGITVAQDLAVIPMLIVLGLMAGDRPNMTELVLQGVGAVGVFSVFIFVARTGEFNLPWAHHLHNDREMQVFASFLVCFTFALVTGMMHLSAALGAFLAGIVIAAGKQAHWVREHMDPFRVVLVGLFFVSIGMLIDLRFLLDNLTTILILTAVVFVTNTLINSVVLRAAGHRWRPSVYGGALLSQIGEFSFILAAVGLQNQIISEYAYSTTIAVICLSLLLSPAWISLIRVLLGRHVLAHQMGEDKAGAASRTHEPNQPDAESAR
ncbi:MAG: cation:proton antiporter [Planctomycetes bacterium]|nr:cation:proton antiporter [Planctomycetota bacterium]NOG53226.1 cation:proton antiporter [Planctomycetota bacterium]